MSDLSQLLARACPKIHDLGQAFYFAPATVRHGEEIGLDAPHFYFAGRGGVLGDVEAPVVASAFGYFEPTLVASMWDSARAVVAPREAGRAWVQSCQEFGRERLAGMGGLDAFCEAADAVNDAAKQQPAALALYAALAAEPLPEDPPARAMQLLATLRELRGSAHLVAVVSTGLSPRTAHYLARPDMYAMFGWSNDNPPEVSDEDRARLRRAEELTDRLVAPAFSVLDEIGGQNLLSFLDLASQRLS